MGIHNVFIDLEKNEVVIENRRRIKEINPEVAIALNASDERPYKLETKQLAAKFDIEGNAVVIEPVLEEVKDGELAGKP